MPSACFIIAYSLAIFSSKHATALMDTEVLECGEMAPLSERRVQLIDAKPGTLAGTGAGPLMWIQGHQEGVVPFWGTHWWQLHLPNKPTHGGNAQEPQRGVYSLFYLLLIQCSNCTPVGRTGGDVLILEEAAYVDPGFFYETVAPLLSLIHISEPTRPRLI
eukprot:2354123-Rhodomonas_salina.4